MKYIIKENRINELITNYLDDFFDVDDINWTYPYEWDSEKHEEYENGNILEFYRGDYDGSDSDFVFQLIEEDYYEPKEFYVGLVEKCPILEVHDDIVRVLKNYFGDLWKEPFRKWFQNNFDLRVKTVEEGMSH